MRPPPARVEVVRDRYGETALDDPYRWMEDTGSEEFSTWLAGQAAYARAVLDGTPHRAALGQRVSALSGGATRRRGYARAGGRLFYLHQPAGAAVPVLRVRDAPDRPDRVLLDSATFGADPHHAIDWYVPSPDGATVAVGVSAGGSENSTMHLLDTGSGRERDHPVSRVWLPFVTWLDDRTVAYHRYEAGAPASGRPPSASRLHRLGEDLATDPVVFARGLNPRVDLASADRPLIAAAAGGWVLGLVSHALLGPDTSAGLSECSLYVAPVDGLADPAACPWVRLAGPADEVSGFACDDDTLYLLCHDGTGHGRVLAVPWSDPDLTRASEIVPASERVVEAVARAGDELLVRDLVAGRSRLRRVRLAGGRAGVPEEIALPVDGTVTEWVPGADGVLLILESWAVPPSRYRYAAGAVRPADAEADGGGDGPDGAVVSDLLRDVVVEYAQVPARDGTLVPVTLARHRDAPRDGERPVLLTAYGSYGIALRPQYRPELLAWYERGGLYVVAHVRGGGEYGRKWRDAGRGPHTERKITDFLDTAAHLVTEGWTRPGRLVASGGSAGAIPVAGAMARRPDLWGAVVLHTPVTNPVRGEAGVAGSLDEFAPGTTAAGRDQRLVADAYLRVADATPYPAVLLTCGRNDPRVDAWQPAKLAARLQAASTSGRPVLLRVEADGGHGFGATRQQEDDLLADKLAFALAWTTTGH